MTVFRSPSSNHIEISSSVMHWIKCLKSHPTSSNFSLFELLYYPSGTISVAVIFRTEPMWCYCRTGCRLWQNVTRSEIVAFIESGTLIRQNHTHRCWFKRSELRYVVKRSLCARKNRNVILIFRIRTFADDTVLIRERRTCFSEILTSLYCP